MLAYCFRGKVLATGLGAFGRALVALMLCGVCAAMPEPTAVDSRGIERINALNASAEQLARTDPAGAEAIATEAMVAARDAQYEQGRIEALHNLGRIARLRGQLLAANAYLLEALSGADALGDLRLVAKVGNSYGAALERQGLDAEALAQHERVQAVWRSLDDVPGLIASSINIARVFEQRGAWSDAQRHYAAAAAQLEAFATPALVPPQDVAAIWLGQGRIALARNQIDQAEVCIWSRAATCRPRRAMLLVKARRAPDLARVAGARGQEGAQRSTAWNRRCSRRHGSVPAVK